MTDADALWWADRIYFGGLIVVALGTLASLYGGIWQYRLNNAIKRESDLAFDSFKREASDNLSSAEKAVSAANAQLEKIRAPRTLSRDAQALVTSATEKFRGQRYRAAISQAADDGIVFWETLHAALQNAGWIYLPAENLGIGTPRAGIPIAAMPGIEIRFDPANEAVMVARASALGNALHSINNMAVAINRDSPGSINSEESDILVIVLGARVPR